MNILSICNNIKKSKEYKIDQDYIFLLEEKLFQSNKIRYVSKFLQYKVPFYIDEILKYHIFFVHVFLQPISSTRNNDG